VTVRVINLSSQDLPEQLDLFIDRTQIERHEKLESVVEQLRDRFGKYAVIPAALCSQNSKMPTDREIELKMPTGMVS